MDTFTSDQIASIKAILKMDPQSFKLVEDSEFYSDSDSDSGCEQIRVKRRPGRPKKVRSPEEIAKCEASKARGRGRPKVERTPEQLAKIALAIAAKEARKQERKEKKLQRQAADVNKEKIRSERKVKAEQKAHEKAQRELVAKVKRNEIYKTMLSDAEAYKSKWNL